MLLREATRRSNNDLQLVLGLLSLHARRAQHPEARQALTDVMERLGIIARSRSTLQRRGTDLAGALNSLCDGLKAQAEPRGIAISCEIGALCGRGPLAAETRRT